MTVRNLNALLRPASVAMIGASAREGSIGGVLTRNLVRGGFQGPVWPVNPKGGEIEGLSVFTDVAALPAAPDLAVIATPAATVPGLIAELGARGTRAAVVIAAGFGEGGSEEGARLRQAALDASRPHLLRILGPNCLGLLTPGIGLNASFAHLPPAKGGLAFVTQSGAIVTAVIDWAAPRGIGFSHMVSLGSMSDVDFGDMLDWLASDRETRAILLYVEAITHSRKFMSAARAASRLKPVIAIKAGRFAAAARAASSHTGALAGVDAVYDAAFRRAGILRVGDLGELFGAVETLARVVRVGGENPAILTNGGGIGVLATDALIAAGGQLPDLSPETIARLDAVLPPTWSRGNPIDIIGDADAARYSAALEVLLTDRAFDAVLVLNCPTAVGSSTDAAQAVIDAVAAHSGAKPLLAGWVGQATAVEGRRMLRRAALPAFATPEDTIRGFMHLVQYRRNRALLMETPPSLPEQFEPDRSAARAIIAAALAENRDWLTEPEAKSVLAAYRVPVVATECAATPQEARAAAARILALGSGVALKILSPDITHKTDVQGVRLNLDSAEEVEDAALRMLERVRAARPDARIDGFTVQAMIRRAAAHETIVGMVEDAQFGPVILFGRGGTAVEVANDKALALPPLNMKLAQELIGETQISRYLGGYRDRPPADRDAIAMTLVKISQLVADFPEIVEMDINPLLADEAGVIALDARIRVRAAARPGDARLAIRPYPSELEEELTLANGQRIDLRPIRAEDEPALREAVRHVDPSDVRMRFFAPMGELSHEIAARLTQIDYDREMALVATDPARGDGLRGVVRIIADPDNQRGEFAIIVGSMIQGRGMGRLLMERIIAYARRRGIGEIWGDVLRENHRMLQLAAELGFRREPHPEENNAVRVVLTL